MDLQAYSTGAIVAFFILGFVLTFVARKAKKQPINLEILFLKAFAASSLPTGLLLLVCAFNPGLLQQLTGLNIYIAPGGLGGIALPLLRNSIQVN